MIDMTSGATAVPSGGSLSDELYGKLAAQNHDYTRPRDRHVASISVDFVS